MHVRVGRRGFGPYSPRLTNRWISSIFRGGGVARLPWKPGPRPGVSRAPWAHPATGDGGDGPAVADPRSCQHLAQSNPSHQLPLPYLLHPCVYYVCSSVAARLCACEHVFSRLGAWLCECAPPAPPIRNTIRESGPRTPSPDSAGDRDANYFQLNHKLLIRSARKNRKLPAFR